MNVQIPTYKNISYSFAFRKNPQSSKNNMLEKQPQRDSFELSVGYINDLHGQTNNMLRILSGIKGDLRFSGGDNNIGDEKNKAVNNAVITFMNMAKINGSAVGNHELDTTQKDFADTASKFNGRYYASNLSQEDLDIKDETLGHEDLSQFVHKSSVIEIKGEKVGIIGAAPIDLNKRVTHPTYHENCSVDELDESVEDIQKEVENLKKQGINKIILLSHMGNLADKITAVATEGIDVIVGGHTHELKQGIIEGENLLYSKSGEPVVITEAGKNGSYFGELNLTFDKDGVITKVQNNIGVTKNFSKNMINQYILNQILGKPEEVGYIKNVTPPPTTLIEENAHANFMCDAMRYELDTDIALWNNSGTRSFFSEGMIDSRDIKDIAPFEDGIAVASVTEKALVDMFKHAIKSTYKTPGHKPGLLAVSGLKYTVNSKKAELVSMSFVDKEGNENVIDVNNPKQDKFYTVAQDTFMMYGGVDYDSLAPKEKCIHYPFNKDFVTCEYIKHLNKPIEINQVGRLNIEE